MRANFIKLFNHLIGFKSLQRTYCFPLPSSVSLWLNIQKHLLFSGSSCAETLLWQKQPIPAPFYLKIISLLLISATLLYLTTISSCKSVEISEPGTSYCLRWKLYCYFLIKSSKARKFYLSLCFLFFFRFFCFYFVVSTFLYWPIYITTANLQCLTLSNPSHPK